MTGRLVGRVAAITGSASGFGEAAARLFVAEGARVALGDIQTDRGRQVAAELGDAARFVECDVTREEHVAALVDLVIGGLGPHAYAAAKHAVVGLTKNVGAELCRFGIRVNCIAPHSMATPMVAMAHLGDPDDIDGVTAELTQKSPLAGRPGLATDVANAALWLASDESGYTNGHCLTTDAGVTTGAKAEDAPYSEPLPMIREAGRTGL